MTSRMGLAILLQCNAGYLASGAFYQNFSHPKEYDQFNQRKQGYVWLHNAGEKSSQRIRAITRLSQITILDA